jgi:hypothetical protein
MAQPLMDAVGRHAKRCRQFLRAARRLSDAPAGFDQLRQLRLQVVDAGQQLGALRVVWGAGSGHDVHQAAAGVVLPVMHVKAEAALAAAAELQQLMDGNVQRRRDLAGGWHPAQLTGQLFAHALKPSHP